MKRMLLLAAAVLPLAVVAQDEPVNGPPLSFYDLAVLGRDAAHHATSERRYDFALNDGFVYSGIVVQLALAPQPLQLINPLAPTEYGNGKQNLSLDPMTKRPMGLNLFALSF